MDGAFLRHSPLRAVMRMLQAVKTLSILATSPEEEAEAHELVGKVIERHPEAAEMLKDEEEGKVHTSPDESF